MQAYSPELQGLAQSGPAGLGFVANLRTPKPEDTRLVSSFAVPPHVALMNAEIQRLAAREYLREGITGLIIEMPPRHGKSEMTSRYTPAWWLGAFPNERVALATYGDDFSSSWGRKARDLIEEFGPSLFGVQVDRRSSAADHWDVRAAGPGRPRHDQGGMATMGVGGQLTGRGADLLIIDDPIKNMAEAQSSRQREAIWDWWVSTARTRLEPGGVVIIVMTRWHDDDLVGRLLRQQRDDPGADRWRRISLPAIAEPGDPLGREMGEALWPQRYSTDVLAKTKRSVGDYVWNALYQQHPVPPGGSLFQWDWFPGVVTVESGVRRMVRYWDMAATEDGGDYTVGLKMARCYDGKNYIADVTRGRWGPEEIEQVVKVTGLRDGKACRVRIEEERGSAGKGLVSHFARNVLPGYNVKGVKSTGDKELRAVPLSAAAQRGEIVLVAGDWNHDFLEEASIFPRGAYDDQVDAASGAYEELERAGSMTAF